MDDPAPGIPDKATLQWQRRLLPLMIKMLVGLTVFFFLASLAQLYYLHTRIADAPQFNMAAAVDGPLSESSSETERMEARRLRLATVLEGNVVARRYHQANIAMMSRVWVHYLGFVTGMTLALIGAAFVLGQLTTRESILDAKTAAVALNWRSASPGLTLAVLGVLLMITTIVVHHEILTTDLSVYFDQDFTGHKAGVPQLPDLEPAKPKESSP